MTTYQVLKHVFNTTTHKTETSKVGQPTLRTKARSLSDKLNDEQVKAEAPPESPLPTHITSFSIAPVEATPKLCQAG
jgi:hypothetical protein